MLCSQCLRTNKNRIKGTCFFVFIWQAKLNEQREHAKQVATFNLQMSEKKEKTYCPLYPVSRTWTFKFQSLSREEQLFYWFTVQPNTKDANLVFLQLYFMLHTVHFQQWEVKVLLITKCGFFFLFYYFLKHLKLEKKIFFNKCWKCQCLVFQTHVVLSVVHTSVACKRRKTVYAAPLCRTSWTCLARSFTFTLILLSNVRRSFHVCILTSRNKEVSKLMAQHFAEWTATIETMFCGRFGSDRTKLQGCAGHKNCMNLG